MTFVANSAAYGWRRCCCANRKNVRTLPESRRFGLGVPVRVAPVCRPEPQIGVCVCVVRVPRSDCCEWLRGHPASELHISGSRCRRLGAGPPRHTRVPSDPARHSHSMLPGVLAARRRQARANETWPPKWSRPTSGLCASCVCTRVSRRRRGFICLFAGSTSAPTRPWPVRLSEGRLGAGWLADKTLV